jgi:hypothetical protein
VSEQQYKAIGWGLLVLTAGVAVYMCANQNGIAGFLMNLTEQATGHRLTQLAWLITFAVCCIPGWMVKNYFEGLAWNAHVANLPPPDPIQAARRSKYVKAPEGPAPAPKPIQISNVAKEQKEFVATCPGCGNFFSAKKQIGPTRCPSCGEVVPVA